MTKILSVAEENFQLRRVYRKEFHKFQTLGEKSFCYEIKLKVSNPDTRKLILEIWGQLLI